MSRKAILINFIIVFCLCGILTFSVEIENPKSIKLAIINEQVKTNTTNIEKIEANLQQLSSELSDPEKLKLNATKLEMLESNLQQLSVEIGNPKQIHTNTTNIEKIEANLRNLAQEIDKSTRK